MLDAHTEAQAASTPPKATRSAQAPERARARVDDEKAVADFMRELLGKLGHRSHRHHHAGHGPRARGARALRPRDPRPDDARHHRHEPRARDRAAARGCRWCSTPATAIESTARSSSAAGVRALLNKPVEPTALYEPLSASSCTERARPMPSDAGTLEIALFRRPERARAPRLRRRADDHHALRARARRLGVRPSAC